MLQKMMFNPPNSLSTGFAPNIWLVNPPIYGQFEVFSPPQKGAEFWGRPTAARRFDRVESNSSRSDSLASRRRGTGRSAIQRWAPASEACPHSLYLSPSDPN